MKIRGIKGNKGISVEFLYFPKFLFCEEGKLD
jgi:hypothetical protein